MNKQQYESLCDYANVLFGLFCGIALALGIIMILSPVSAFPLQLFPNGTIVDLGSNTTINGTSVDFIYSNDTLYIIPKVNDSNITFQNVSYFNVTNVTNVSYGNITNITNITLQNYTNCSFNYTYYNVTGNYSYNKSEIDDFLSKRYIKSEVDSIKDSILVTTTDRVNAVKTELTNTFNSTETDKDFVKTNSFFLGLGILAFILLICFFILWNRE